MNYKLRKQYSVEPELALKEILRDRGVEDVDKFLYPSKKNELNPFLLDGMREGVKMLHRHLENESKILIVVDCDVDGFESGSILWLYIKNWYPNANLTYSLHEGKQHGLDDKIDWILEQDFNLVIVPDAGSYDKEEMEKMVEKGIEVLCEDHHAPFYDENGNLFCINSPHAVIINNQLSPNYPNKTLCGAGVVYKFCEAIDITFQRNDASNYLDLVAVGEIADVMFQGTSETRYFIMEGLKNIKNEGLKALLTAQSHSLKEKAEEPFEGLTPMDIAFYIGPLINAIIRIGRQEEKEALFLSFIEPMKKLQSTKRGAKEGDWEYACQQTARVAGNARNRQNKAKDRAIDLLEMRACKEGLLDNNVIIIPVEEEDNIPQELTGLIAMSFVSKYRKPCLIGRENADGLFQGSIRNDGNFEAMPDLKEYLEKSGFFTYVSGHANAAGFGLPRENIQKFLTFTNTDLNEASFQSCYIVDYVLDANDKIYNLLFSLADAPECFGNGIDEIRIIVKNIAVSSPFFMGAEKDSTKISYRGIDYVRFKDVEFAEKAKENEGGEMNALVCLNINNWGGKQTVQCFINDYEFVKSKIDHRFDF